MLKKLLEISVKKLIVLSRPEKKNHRRKWSFRFPIFPAWFTGNENFCLGIKEALRCRRMENISEHVSFGQHTTNCNNVVIGK